MNTTGTQHHRIVIVGGGTAGITVAARLFKTLGQPDVAIIEPSGDHYYQPLWTLVGGGVFKKEIMRRAERHLIPRGATWIQESVRAFQHVPGSWPMACLSCTGRA